MKSRWPLVAALLFGHDRLRPAFATLDGWRLAVLADSGIWLFERDGGGFLARPGHWLSILAKRAEGITFAGDDLMVVNEQGEMFRIAAKPPLNQDRRPRKIGER